MNLVNVAVLSRGPDMQHLDITEETYLGFEAERCQRGDVVQAV